MSTAQDRHVVTEQLGEQALADLKQRTAWLRILEAAEPHRGMRLTYMVPLLLPVLLSGIIIGIQLAPSGAVHDIRLGVYLLTGVGAAAGIIALVLGLANQRRLHAVMALMLRQQALR